MKNLLYKELKLVVTPGTYFFCACALLLLIPAYPYFVGVSYTVMSFLINFGVARDNRDHEFSAILPVPRDQIVLAKHLHVLILEGVTILVAIPAALVSSLWFNPNGNVVGMDANFAFFGFTLAAYAAFNVVFLTKYFKTGYKVGMPIAFGLAAYLAVVAAVELLVHVVPGLAVLDGLDPAHALPQLGVLLAGIVLYVVGMVASYRMSVRRFDKVSL
ncbi:MAG: ABC-2 transporter permease [Candidatus Izemoplasmatales bacterium]